MGILTVGADLLLFALVLLFSFSNLIIVGKRLIKTCLKRVVEEEDESHMAHSLFLKKKHLGNLQNLLREWRRVYSHYANYPQLICCRCDFLFLDSQIFL